MLHFVLLTTIYPGVWALLPTDGVKGEAYSEICGSNIHSWTAETWGKNDDFQNHTKNDGFSPFGTPRSTEGKILLLQSTYNGLMEKIDTHVEAMGAREARGHKGTMGSTEGALITISLLTFAVYLIKLVTMLVHALHDKKASSSGMLGSTAQPAGVQTFVVSHGRKRRNIYNGEKNHDWQLLSLIKNINNT